jgi:hypothetical protein
MADPNALRNFLAPSPMPARGLGSGAAISTDDDGTLTPEGRRKLRPIGGSRLDLPGASTNALAAVAGPSPDSGQPSNALNPGSVLTPFGWMPAGLASQLADYLTPSRRDVADTLGAPVDAGSYLLHRLAGLNVPTTTPSSSTHTYQPAASVPFSSAFFNNLMGDAGNLSAEAWRRLRR